MKGIYCCSNKGSRHFPRRDDNKITKNMLKKFLKSSSLEPLCQFRPNLAQSILGWRGLKFSYIKDYLILRKEQIFFSLNLCYSIIKLCTTVFIDSKLFLRWAIWPMGLVLLTVMYLSSLIKGIFWTKNDITLYVYLVCCSPSQELRRYGEGWITRP